MVIIVMLTIILSTDLNHVLVNTYCCYHDIIYAEAPSMTEFIMTPLVAQNEVPSGECNHRNILSWQSKCHSTLQEIKMLNSTSGAE